MNQQQYSQNNQMQKKYIGITDNFFSKNEYIRNYGIILQRQKIFTYFLNFLLHSYQVYINFGNRFIKEQKTQQNKQNNSIFYNFKFCLDSFMKLFQEIVTYEHKQILKLSEKKQMQISIHFHSLINELQKFQPKQNQYQEKIIQINKKTEKLNKDITIAKKDKNTLINSFNEYYFNPFYKKFKEDINQIQTVYNEVTNITQDMITKRQHFYNQIDNFRKSISSHRFEILDRFKQISQKKKQGFLMLFFILRENIKNDKIKFTSYLSQSQTSLKKSKVKYQKSKIQLSKSDKNQKFQFSKNSDNFILQIANVTDQYNKQLYNILKFLNLFKFSLKQLNKQFRQQFDKYRQIVLYNLSSKFEASLTPLKFLNEIFQVIQTSTNKFIELEKKIEPCIGQLQLLAQNIKVHSEISISLIKSSTTKSHLSNKSIEQNNKNITYHTATLQSMMNSTSLQDSLIQIFNIFENQLKSIIEWAETRFPKKKKVNKFDDSMNLTIYQDEQLKLSTQRSSQELWLYLQDRKIDSFKIINIDQLKKEIETIKPPIIADTKKQIQSFDAILGNQLNIKGKLSIYDDSVRFLSANNQILLIIKFPSIQSSFTKTKIFVGKYLSIQTNQGKIVFEYVSDLQKCKKVMNQTIQKSQNQVVQVKKQKRQKIILEAAELASIQKRIIQTKNQLIDKSEFNIKLQQIQFKDVTIEEVYGQIYSDQEKIIKGKKFQNFTCYYTFKGNNIKIKTTKYQPPGPKFYTLNSDVTFTNCHLFSERKLEYDHPIPKINIPMMPKFCQCKEIQKIYWISHEQFQYYIQCYSSGAPYTTSFFVRFLHTIKKKENNVEIQICGGVKFIQQPMIKAMLKEKSQSQMKQNGQKYVDLIKQQIQRLKGNISEQKQIETKQKNGDQKQKTQNNEIIKQLEQMKKQKKMILVVSICILIISILIRLF